MYFRSTFAALAFAALSACEPVTFAENTTTLERTLTVREIDPVNRGFTVVGDGQRFNVTVSDAVVNFDRIEVGDRVNLTYSQSIAVSMALPGDSGETVSVSTAALAPVGAKPGAAAGELISTVVTFVAFDPRSNTATVQTQEGGLLIAQVAPELRRFAAARQPGEQIVVEFTEALVVGIEPVS